MSPSEVFQNPKSYGSTLLIQAMDRYGTEIINWEPEILNQQVEDDFGEVRDPRAFDRLQAACSVLSTDAFFLSLAGFSVVCDALNFGAPVTDSFVPCELDDVMWGVTEAKLLLGEDFVPKDFSNDVKLFVGRRLADESVFRPPSILGFARFSPETVEARDEQLALDDMMNAAVEKRQSETLEELNAEAANKLIELVDQVSNLNLENGNADALLKHLRNEGE